MKLSHGTVAVELKQLYTGAQNYYRSQCDKRGLIRVMKVILDSKHPVQIRHNECPWL